MRARQILNMLPEKLQHKIRQAKYIGLKGGEPELRYLPEICQGADIAIDVGANIGLYSEILSKHAKDVIAFEPSEMWDAYLAKVLPANVRVIKKGLSDHVGSSTLRMPKIDGKVVHGFATLSENEEHWGEVTVEGEVSETVDLTTLDAVLAEPQYAGRKVDFIKIDVEGHEWSAINGARGVIEQHRPVLLVETEYRHKAPVADIFAYFESQNFAAKSLIEGELAPMDADKLASMQDMKQFEEKFANQSSGVYINNVFFFPQ